MLDMVYGEIDEFLPLRDVVFQKIRKAILKGELVPGERLMEIGLANRLGVSRTPVREAIRKLELEGLVVMTPRKGAVVAGITEKNLRDVLEVRRALEELAIELACRRMNAGMVDELRLAQENFKAAIQSGVAMDIAKTDEMFHDIIFNGTQNERLIMLLNNLREHMYRYRLEYIKDADTREALIAEHEQILTAIGNNEAAKAKEWIRAHIDNQEIAISKNIK